MRLGLGLGLPPGADTTPAQQGGGAPSDPHFASVVLLAGRLKAVRITKGTARYASDGGYTVPTLPLPTS